VAAGWSNKKFKGVMDTFLTPSAGLAAGSESSQPKSSQPKSSQPKSSQPNSSQPNLGQPDTKAAEAAANPVQMKAEAKPASPPKASSTKPAPVEVKTDGVGPESAAPAKAKAKAKEAPAAAVPLQNASEIGRLDDLGTTVLLSESDPPTLHIASKNERNKKVPKHTLLQKWGGADFAYANNMMECDAKKGVFVYQLTPTTPVWSPELSSVATVASLVKTKGQIVRVFGRLGAGVWGWVWARACVHLGYARVRASQTRSSVRALEHVHVLSTCNVVDVVYNSPWVD
jgi:hypothetical protein